MGCQAFRLQRRCKVLSSSGVLKEKRAKFGSHSSHSVHCVSLGFRKNRFQWVRFQRERERERECKV